MVLEFHLFTYVQPVSQLCLKHCEDCWKWLTGVRVAVTHQLFCLKAKVSSLQFMQALHSLQVLREATAILVQLNCLARIVFEMSRRNRTVIGFRFLLLKCANSLFKKLLFLS